jgi:hypothetical protein
MSFQAWSRIKDIDKNSRQSLATLIKNFYGGLDEWSRSFPDSLTSGKFSSGDPSHAINLMDDLFGSSVKPIEELGIKKLKNYIDRAILELQTYMEEFPTKNEISSLSSMLALSLEKLNKLCPLFLKNGKPCQSYWFESCFD